MKDNTYANVSKKANLISSSNTNNDNCRTIIEKLLQLGWKVGWGVFVM